VCQDVKAEQVRSLLEYMYKGEVSVGQEELPALLRVAELLRVKGMVEENEEEEERNPLNSNTPVVKKEAKEPMPPTPNTANNRPRTSSPPSSSAHPSRSSSPLRSGDNGGGGSQLMLPAIPTTSSSGSNSNNNSNPALTPTSGGSSLPPPPHHLPPNFRPFLSSPGGPGGPSHTPPFPMWPLPGLFPGAHNLFSSPRGEGAGRAGSPGLKESASSARHRLNSGQDKEQHQLAIPPLMPRDSLEEKQVGKLRSK
jgi:hypothetical protein